jgi:hypothetical protein
MAVSLRPLDGYPDAIGAHKLSVVGIQGPTSYTQLTSASPVATGGQLIEAATFGFKGFDFVAGGLSDSGTYRVDAVPYAPTGAIATPTANTSGATSRYYRLAWYVRATGAEAAGSADLDAEIVRVLAVGNK